jgi:hypothetical protein
MANSPTVFRDLQTSLERAGFKADIKQTNISEAEIRITKGNRAGNAIAMKLSVVESPVGPTFVIHLGSQQFLEAPDLVISSTSGNVNTDLQTSSMQLQARVAAAFSGGASRFGSTAQKAFSGSLREEGYGSHPAKILPTGASPTITESSFGAIHVTFRGEGGMGEPTLFMKGILSDYIADALGSVRASGLPIVTKPTTTGVGKPVTATWGDIAQWVPLWTKGDYLQKTTGIARTLGDRWEGIVPFTYERGGKSFSLAMGGTNNLLIPLMRRKGGGVPWQEMTAEELRGTPGEDVRYARGSLLAFNASTPEYFWRQNLLAAPIAGLPGGMLRPLGSRQPEEMGLRGTDIAKMPFTQLFTTPSGGTGVMEMLQSGQLKIRNIIGAKIGGGERITMARFTDEQGNTIPIFAGKTRSPAWTPSAEVWEIPKYVNPITGVFSASNKPGTREVTADEIKALTESSGVSVVTAEGIKTPRIRMEGWTHPNFGKWRDVIKGGGVESTERQNVQVGGQTIRIDEITEEFKSGVALHKILESRSPEQLEFLFQKYAAISKNPGAVEFANWYHENFVAVTTSPGQMRPAADINVLSAKLAEFTSGSKSTKYAAYLGGTGLELEQELFKRIIIPATAGSPENAELIKRFGMGRVPDTSENRIEAGRIHPHSIDILYQEALQRINDPTAAKRYMEENFEFQAPDGSVLSFEDALHYNVTSGQLPKMREHLGNAYLIIGMPESMPAEYQASRALIEASQAGFINSQFPKFWKAVTRPGDRQGFSQVDIALSSYMKFQSQYSEASEIYAVENKDYIAHLAAIQKRGQEAATTGDQEAYRAISEREAAFPSPGAELFHDIQMPTKYTEVTADAGHNISAWLTANSDKTVAEKMQYVSKVLSAMPGGIQGELLHFGSGFLPTPAIAERATYTDRITGKPIANISNLWLKAIQLMGSQAVDVANQNPTIEEINAMNRAQEGFYNEINKEISAHQGRYKGALSTLAVSGVSGRYAVSRLLGANEIYVPKSSLTRVLREMGFRGDELKTALAQAMGGENIQALGARVPSLPREEQTQAVTLVSYANMLKRVGSPSEIDALQKAKDIFYVSPWISKLGEGDLDYDQALFVLGFRKTENGKLQSVKTGEFLGKAAVTSADAMARMLQMGLQFEESPDKKIDIINKIIEMTSWKDITKLLKTSWRMTALKGPGAGSRYNLTRLISPIMMTGGASAEKVSTFYSTTQKIYTPGLDTWDTVRRMEQLGGRLVSAMTRGSIRTSAYGGTRLHYGSFKESSQYPGFVGIDIFAGEISGTPEEVMGKMEGIMSLAGMPLEMEKGSKHPEKYNEWMPKSLATIATFAEED